MQVDRSQGFPRTGYLVPARDAPGVLPDVESSWDAAVAVAAVPPATPAGPPPRTADRRVRLPRATPAGDPGAPYAFHTDQDGLDGSYIGSQRLKIEDRSFQKVKNQVLGPKISFLRSSPQPKRLLNISRPSPPPSRRNFHI